MAKLPAGSENILIQRVRALSGFLGAYSVISSAMEEVVDSGDDLLPFVDGTYVKRVSSYENLPPIVDPCYYLNAVILELIVKIFNLMSGKKDMRSHGLDEIYLKLSDNYRSHIERLYSEMAEEVRGAASKLETQFGKVRSYCNIVDALKHNKKIMTDFKYEGSHTKENIVFRNILFFDNDSPLFIVEFSYIKRFFYKLLEIIEKDTKKIRNELVHGRR